MLIKYIECEVKPTMKKPFSIAQQQWNITSKAEGFLGQVGGWNFNNNGEACILSFWEKQEDLNTFMKTLHDEIIERNKQSETYQSIKVFHFTTNANSLIKNSNNLKHLIQYKKLTINCINKFTNTDTLKYLELSMISDFNKKNTVSISNIELSESQKSFEKNVILDKLWTVLP